MYITDGYLLHTKTNFYIIELLLLQEKKPGIGNCCSSLGKSTFIKSIEKNLITGQ